MRRAVLIIATSSILTTSLGAHTSPLHARTALERTLVGKIAYASDVDGDFEIFVMRPDGTRPRQITHNRVDDVNPSWSPDGTRIVFERETPFYGEDLYIVDVADGPAAPWIVTKNFDEAKPRWSPDGESIAYRVAGPEDDLQVSVIRLDGSSGKSIWAEENASVSWPAWSPDSSKVAFVVFSDGASIGVAHACCTSPSDFDSVSARTEWPAGLDWSRDGACLVFGDVGERGYDLYTVPVGGGTPRAITRDWSDSYPGSWSPDSSQIVYDSNASRSWDIYVIDADGSDLHRLTRTPNVHEISPDWWAPPDVEPTAPPCGKASRSP